MDDRYRNTYLNFSFSTNFAELWVNDLQLVYVLVFTYFAFFPFSLLAWNEWLQGTKVGSRLSFDLFNYDSVFRRHILINYFVLVPKNRITFLPFSELYSEEEFSIQSPCFEIFTSIYLSICLRLHINSELFSIKKKMYTSASYGDRLEKTLVKKPSRLNMMTQRQNTTVSQKSLQNEKNDSRSNINDEKNLGFSFRRLHKRLWRNVLGIDEEGGEQKIHIQSFHTQLSGCDVIIGPLAETVNDDDVTLCIKYEPMQLIDYSFVWHYLFIRIF